MFHQMPWLLLAIFALLGIVNPWIPLPCKSGIYALSLSLKALILFVLPLLIFGLLFKTAVQLAKRASSLIFLLLMAICLSNFCSTLISYAVGTFAYQLDLAMPLPIESGLLEPLWNFSPHPWIRNDLAMALAMILGLVLSRLRPQLAQKFSHELDRLVNQLLKLLLYIIPFFISGFVIKMYHDGVMLHMLRTYAIIFSIVAGAVFSYIGFIYLLGCGFNLSRWAASIKNMLPAAIAGFGSMSSAAAMPLTILATEKNATHPKLAGSIIPATVNIHLMGDCFAIPIFAMAILKSFGFEEPSFFQYLSFALYFVMAKFSVAAVPGGGVLVMLPILASTLHFNGDMLSLITALYILFDPVITSANIFGNGGFAMLLSRLIKETPEET